MNAALSRDEARQDMAAYHKAVAAGRYTQAVEIERKWNLYGLPPRLVSVGLEAASQGLDALMAASQAQDRRGGAS